jgi:hypothetical protein
MRSSVCPALTTAAIVHGLSTDHDRRRGQRCTVLTHPVSLIHRGISVQINRATSFLKATDEAVMVKQPLPPDTFLKPLYNPTSSRFDSHS